MSSRQTLGVDPGQGGGLAILDGRQAIVAARRMPLLRAGSKKIVDGY